MSYTADDLKQKFLNLAAKDASLQNVLRSKYARGAAQKACSRLDTFMPKGTRMAPSEYLRAHHPRPNIFLLKARPNQYGARKLLCYAGANAFLPMEDRTEAQMRLGVQSVPHIQARPVPPALRYLEQPGPLSRLIRIPRHLASAAYEDELE